MNVSKFYDDYLTQNQRAVIGNLKLLRIIEILRLVSMVRAPGKKNVEIHDFGCGEGILSSILSHVGNVTGCDISKKAIEEAQRQYPKVKFFEIDAEKQQVESRFDIVVSQEVIEHIRNKENYLQSCRQCLRAGGFLILTTPNKSIFDQRIGGNWSSQPIEELLTKRELIRLIEKDFEILHFTSVGLNVANKGMHRIINHRYLVQMLRMLQLNSWRESFLRRFGYGLHMVLLAKKKDGL